MATKITIDLGAIDKAIEKAQGNVRSATAIEMAVLALAVDDAVVSATPVDTGRARGNWIPSINTPVEQADPNRLDPGGSLGRQAMQAALASFKAGDTVCLTNNIAYIGRLNDGSSRQAPAGFVDKAVQAARAATRQRRVL